MPKITGMMLKIFEKIIALQNDLYAECGFKVKNFMPEPESADYCAHSYELDDQKILFRIAKKTPTKSGRFVTVWKREHNITTPYDESDSIDFFVISVFDQDQIGQFIFSKTALIKEKIISTNRKGGKRGFRVYSPYDRPTNTQAEKTQRLQSPYFIDLATKTHETIPKMKALYNM